MGDVRVYLVHPFVLHAECVAFALDRADDLRVVGFATSACVAVDAVRALRPDVVVMPDELEGATPAALVSPLREAAPNAAFVVVAQRATPKGLAEALGAGIIGYLPGQRSLDALADCVQTAAAGVSAVPPELLTALATARDAPVVRLSRRELEVVSCLAQGLTTDAIGARLSISSDTVRKHVRAAMTKYGAHSRLELVRRALEAGSIAHDGRLGGADDSCERLGVGDLAHGSG